MTKKTNKISSINSFCSAEQLVKFVGKLCIFNLTFMNQGVTGRVKEVNDNFILLEMRDGRLLCARIDSVLGFAMAKINMRRRSECQPRLCILPIPKSAR